MKAKPTVDDFLAKPGDDVRETLKMVGDFLKADSTVITGDGAYVDQLINGKRVVVTPDPSVFSGAFKVRLTGARSVTFGIGLVELVDIGFRVPKIGDQYIDGRDENGDAYPEGSPVLELSGGGPRSLVGIVVRGGESDGADEIEVVMVERAIDAAEPDPGNLTPETFKPVASIEWSADGDRVLRVRPLTYFDQRAELRTRPGSDVARWVIAANL